MKGRAARPRPLLIRNCIWLQSCPTCALENSVFVWHTMYGVVHGKTYYGRIYISRELYQQYTYYLYL